MDEVSISYRLVVWFFLFIKKVFFRDVIVRGSHKIPRNCPVIFVAAPHCNQFVDPIILISSCPRPIGFLMAAISLKRRIVGFFGKMLNSIPVDRAQDYAKKCSGRIFIASNEDSLKLMGENTLFLEEISKFPSILESQSAVLITYEKECFCAPIDRIIDNYQMILKKPFDSKIESLLKTQHMNFSIVPLIDQTTLYASVFQRLSKNQCIGIFPEGGSHDRAEMLPLKAGIAIMSLGYLSIYPESTLKIVPCGLNYFNAHKFRSRAVIEFGEPIDVPTHLVNDFKLGGESKRKAIEKVLEFIADSLKCVTVSVPSFEILQVVQAARRLYRSEDTHKKPEMQLELNRRFTKGYLKYRDDPKISQLHEMILDYNNLLIAFGIKDHQVKNTQISCLTSVWQLLYHLSILIVFGIVSLPGFLINAPALYLISRISKGKAKAAKRASNVKIHGNDVISTWKLLVAIVLLPLLYGLYSIFLMINFPLFVWHIGILRLVEFTIFIYSFAILSFATVRLSEMFLNSYYSIWPLVLVIANPKKCYMLRQVRATLREQINLIVDEFGPSVVDNFEHNRIIKSPTPSISGRTTPLSSFDSIQSPDLVLSNSTSDFSSGRASPIFDTNMEVIENMLAQCKNMVKKQKVE
jgi:glycerol-3-phosphate O-acyltransferase / dihydroxyacetone phosphate acyltransferase